MTETETSQGESEPLEPEQKRKIFIGSLSYQIEEDVFRDYWTKFGTVIEATILRDRDGHSRGFGFVTFAESSSVDAVMKSRPHTLGNRVVEAKRAVPREETHKPNIQLSVKKLYLGGVKEPITENDLRDYFGQYGNIVDVIIMKDRDGQYRGYGFVEFDDYDPVDRVILEKSHLVCDRSIDVQKAQARDASQRPSNPRSRSGPSGMSGPNYNRPYNGNSHNYPPNNNFNAPYESMSNQNFNSSYGSNFNDRNSNWTPFGQDYHQDEFAGPIRRGSMNGAGRVYTPYNNRSDTYGHHEGSDANEGASWTSWA